MTDVAQSPMLPVQVAIFQRLTGDATLMGLINGVFDHVPEGTEQPYVEIGEAWETPDNDLGTFGRETVATLHVWTRTRGYSQGLTIKDRLVALLDHQPLTITGQHHVQTRYEFSQTLRDPDPEIRHVPIRFRVITEQT